MVRINNSELSNELRDVAKIQAGADIIPNILSNQVVPVIDVNPKHSRIANFIRHANTTATGVNTIYTTPANIDTYITSVYLSISKDAANDSGTGSINVSIVLNGATVRIAALSIINLTAQDKSIVIPFPIPIKVDNSSTILLSGAFTAGTLTRECGITGYQVSNPNA